MILIFCKIKLYIISGYESSTDKCMRCTGIKKYDGRVAIDEEHTRHNRCASRGFSNLGVVDASGLDGSLLLLVGRIGAVSLHRLRCRIVVSGLRAAADKMTWSSTVEAGVLGKR